MLLSTAAIVEKATSLLPALSKRDALTVWKGVGLYLQDQLCERRRMVTVDGWGFFGMNAMGEAVFVHSAAFLQANRLRERLDTGVKGQPMLIASKPMPKLNAAEVGEEYLQNCRKETVAAVVAHVVAFIGRTAKQGNQVVMSLTVAPLGEWRCDGEGRVEFRFTPEFQAQMLRSEGKAVKKRSIEEHEKEEDEKKSEKEETPQQLTRAALQEHTQQQRNVPLRAIPDHRQPSRVRSATSASSQPTASSHPSKTHRPTTAWTEHSTAAESESTDITNSVRAKLLSRCGEQGLNALNRILSLMDTSGDGVLSAQELKFGLRDLGIELSTKELRDVVTYFDRDGDGNVSLEELLDRLRGKLSTRRKVLMERAFNLMDRERKGFVTLADIKDNYDVSFLPRVRAGKVNKARAMEEFLREWETSEGYDGHLRGVTRDAFRRYYHNISAGMREDSDFELLMRQTWHVTMSTPDEDCENEDAQDVSAMLSKKHHEIRPPSQHKQVIEPTKRPPATPAQSAQDQNDWTYLRAALLPARLNGAAPTIDDISRRLGANRVWGDGNDSMNTRAFANALCRLDRVLSSKDAVAIAQRVRDVCTETEPHQEGGDLIVLKILLQRLCSRSISSPSTSVAKNASSGTSPVTSIVDRIRHRLKERLMCTSGDVSDSPNTRPNPELAVLGLNALARTLRLMDANGDKRLTKDELKVGLRKCGVDVTFHELDQLYTVLDSDRSGCIDFDEFLVAMRGKMNARRLDFVHEAFALLDRDGDGVVTSQEVAAAYDVSKHPEVLAGRLSAAEALNLFIQHWDNIDKDGNITRAEFEKYYQNVSASIDNDDYFELMMRNAWHISGGSGWRANTTNRRVLATNKDGLQTVEEVQNDLGITAPEKIHAKLKAQGINVQKVETTGV
ncbi:hypothetical protein Poli38472_003616 [Pythium oligandrum]|uniref:EF-hand domain-containing protein n=1 Tax=Pythium oligandrum TaxID=41045 RepID=A0A8K1FKA8_PYTOL|nr:hypothetical protein Poli38472_003616 [Pythium oligandrum]|eukprot:TMW65851.1 hypothetical protein Poli38472_003616 [Pythium oligandrum]